MAELKTPRFLVEGDQSTVVGTIRNYLDGQHIAGKTQFCVGTDTLKRQEVSFTEGFHETVPMQAAHTDSVTISYLFTRDDGYQDGEEYTIRYCHRELNWQRAHWVFCPMQRRSKCNPARMKK